MNKKVMYIIVICLFMLLVLGANILLKKNVKQYDELGGFVQKIASSNFDSEVLKSDKKVLIDFYATWCGPCQVLSPIIEEVASETSDIKFVKIDIDENEELAEEYGVVYIPTLVVIENGKETKRSVGAISKDELLELIK